MIRNSVTDLNGNLSRNPISGDITLKKDEEAIKQHLDLLLLSGEYAAIGRPFLCAGLRSFLFEHASSATVEEIKARVRNTVAYEKRVRARDIRVVFDTNTKYVHIEIDLEFVSADKSFTYTTKLRRIA